MISGLFSQVPQLFFSSPSVARLLTSTRFVFLSAASQPISSFSATLLQVNFVVLSQFLFVSFFIFLDLGRMAKKRAESKNKLNEFG